MLSTRTLKDLVIHARSDHIDQPQEDLSHSFCARYYHSAIVHNISTELNELTDTFHLYTCEKLVSRCEEGITATLQMDNYELREPMLV